MLKCLIRGVLSLQFIKHYYRYADHMFLCRQNAATFPEIKPEQVDFDLFASAEYARMLEREWEEE